MKESTIVAIAYSRIATAKRNRERGMRADDCHCIHQCFVARSVAGWPGVTGLGGSRR
jgi:hypothetical protein